MFMYRERCEYTETPLTFQIDVYICICMYIYIYI